MFLNDIHNKTANVIAEELQKGQTKPTFSIQTDLVKDTPNGLIHTNPNPYFSGNTTAILNNSQINDFLQNAYAKIQNSHEGFIKNGSGWRNHRILSANLEFARYQPPEGSSYIDLTPYLKNKKGNDKNTDNQCFKWSVLSALYPVDKHAQRVSK